MLAAVGLVEGEDYTTVLIDGFDPLVHIELPGIVGFPGYKSNEPGQLERAGVDFDLFAPSELRDPRFLRGALHDPRVHRRASDRRPGLPAGGDARARRRAGRSRGRPRRWRSSASRPAAIPSFLSLEGETFRWTTDVELITAETPEGTGVGVPDPGAAAGGGRRLRGGRPVR